MIAIAFDDQYENLHTRLHLIMLMTRTIVDEIEYSRLCGFTDDCVLIRKGKAVALLGSPQIVILEVAQEEGDDKERDAEEDGSTPVIKR